MASGRLGAVDLGAAANTTVYVVPASTLASFTVVISNRNAGSAFVRLALAATASPSTSEYILYNLEVNGNESISVTGLLLDAEKYVVAYSDVADVSVVCFGYEDIA